MTLLLLGLLACGASSPEPEHPPTRDELVRIATDHPDPAARYDAAVDLYEMKDPEVSAIFLAQLRRLDRAGNPALAERVGSRLKQSCMRIPIQCEPCKPCPPPAPAACTEIDWDRDGCFPGEGDACPVPDGMHGNYPMCPPSNDLEKASLHVAHAVALVQAHPGEAIDPCDTIGWAFQALAELNKAVETRPASIDDIRERADLAPLRASDVYARWDAVATIDWNDREATAAWAAGQSWHRTGDDPADLVLSADGKYTVKRAGKVAATGTWKVLAPRELSFTGGPFGFLRRTNLGVWMDAQEWGIFLADATVCDR